MGIKVSVVMSVFNAEKHLAEAIESILNQTFTDFEFIIFEDGSADTSLEILKQFADRDERVRLVIKNKNNGYTGMIENLNKGISMAKGKYIARMDADDVALPDRFKKQIEYLDNHPDVFILGTGVREMGEQGNPRGIYKPFRSNFALRVNLPYRNCFYHPTVMFRKNSEFKYRLPFVEDYDMWLQMLKAGKKMANIQDILLKYRLTDNSLSRDSKIRTLSGNIAAVRLYKGELEFDGFDINKFVEDYSLDLADDNKKSELLRVAYFTKDYVAMEEIWAVYSSTAFAIDRCLYYWGRVKLYMFNFLKRVKDV